MAFDREEFVRLVRLASSPLTKALIAIAYYAESEDPEVAEAVWEPTLPRP